MDKEFILGYLELEHIKDIQSLQEIAEFNGIERVKEMYRDHEGARLYIPMVLTNPKLLKAAVSANYKNMSLRALADKMGLRRSKIKELIREIEGR